MFARILTFRFHPSRRGDFEAKLEELRARIEAIPGMVDVYICMGEGGGVGVALYETREAAERAIAINQAALAVMDELYIGTPSAEHFERVMHFPGTGGDADAT